MIAAGGRGFYEYDGDPTWFEGGQPITESLEWERHRRRLQQRRRVEGGEAAAAAEGLEEDQDAFWRRKDRWVIVLWMR